jgi:hypothetical protein
MEELEVKKRAKYVTKKRIELENLLTAAKEFQFQPKREKESSRRNPATIAEYTKDSCMYPARYLNSDNTCVSCDVYEHCACALKNLGRKRKSE